MTNTHCQGGPECSRGCIEVDEEFPGPMCNHCGEGVEPDRAVIGNLGGMFCSTLCFVSVEVYGHGGDCELLACQGAQACTLPPHRCEHCGEACPADDCLPTRAGGRAHAVCAMRVSLAFAGERAAGGSS